jgi:2-keto-4-pentenoate hydratase/2-oxohepta-3-ene-1,7-dioic acid hydratase in catechol pathway
VQDQSDYEVELVIVIGKECRDITPEQAADYIIGVSRLSVSGTMFSLTICSPQYTICNDVSARKKMFATSQWGMGKTFDGWLPLGPCLLSSAVLPIEHAQSLNLQAHLATSRSLHSAHKNPLQNGSTADQLWKIAETVSSLSYGTTLRVGDIICTGTPAGQGSSKEPQLWLEHGDEITVSGEGIGSLRNTVQWEQPGSGKARL